MPYGPKVCEACGASYIPNSGCAKLCEACRSGECAGCGRPFRRQLMRGRLTRYCSNACYLAQRWQGHRVVKTCAQCGKSIAGSASGIGTFCGYRCRSLYAWAQPEWRAKIVAGLKESPKVLAHRMSQRFPRRMTSIEAALHDEFKKRRLRFEMHRTMFERWQPDFVFEGAMLIVQADGDYWHSRPGMAARDATFDAIATAEGWTVMRFSERVIREDAARCARAVARFVRGHHPTTSP